MASRKIILTCAVTGSADTVSKNPAVPVTPDAIAASALDAAKAGAAIVHIHVRDPESGQASMEIEHYRRTVGLIRDSGSDVVINLTTGVGARYELDSRPARETGAFRRACPCLSSCPIQHNDARRPHSCRPPSVPTARRNHPA